MNDETPQGATKPRRKKSQKRQRDKQIKVNFLSDEFNPIAARAEAAGMSLAAYVRTVLLGDPGPRALRKPPADAELLSETLGQLLRVGNNVNQIAYQANAHGDLPMEAQLREMRAMIDGLADMLMGALGKETPSKA